jgi:primosomal protein N' (replication factor Y)
MPGPLADIVPLGTRIDRAMTYQIPEDLLDSPSDQPRISEGSRVLIPLGPRWATGIVVGFHDTTELDNVRSVAMCLDPYPVITPQLLATCRWIASYYLCTLGEVLTAALPAGIHTQSDQRISIAPDAKLNGSLPERQSAVVSTLQEAGDLNVRQLERRLGKGTRRVVHELVRKGILETQLAMVDPRVRVSTERIACLLPTDPDWAASELPALRKRAPRQADCLDYLLKNEGTATTRELNEIGIDSSVLRRLADRHLLELNDQEVVRDPYAQVPLAPLETFDPTRDQRQALDRILPDVAGQHFRVHLIHGVTGSGKTLVYIEAVAAALEKGRGAIVLIPEIALTPQTVRRFRARFGDRVAVLHSALSAGERYDAWRQLREGRRQVVVGARSAVFAPIPNLGLIVVDEEHDGSYKQESPAPRYSARDVAVVRGQQEAFPVVLGSATPSLESYHNARTGKFDLIELPGRIDDRPLPEVRLVDMRQEGGDLFSTPLRTAIQDRLKKDERIILLQNRRGYAPFIQCTDCGTALECASCQVTLTFHAPKGSASGHMICHYCGRTEPKALVCASCSSSRLRLFGSGTQRIEEAILERFPDARVLRMDVDSTTQKGAHERILDAFGRGEADILLGTQMVAKGLDFAGVTLVGVISADTGLSLPDFRAGERTFQLLTQVAGRAGRGDIPGDVIIQTYRPEEEPLLCARTHDYATYSTGELETREDLGYPPYGRMTLFLFRGPDEPNVAQAAGECAETLRFTDPAIDVLGPVPAPLARLRGRYRWQVIAKSSSAQRLNRAARHVMESHHRRAVTLNVDVDPVSML